MGRNISNFRQFFVTALVAIAGLLLVVYIASGKPVAQPQPLLAPPAPIVKVLEVRPVIKVLSVKSQGSVEPRREIDIIAEVSGKVTEVAASFAAGAFFQQGQQLAQIDERDYRYALVRTEAKVADAEQLLAIEKGRVRQAKREWRDLGNNEANRLFLPRT